jgi:hypothetical protein
VKASTAQLVPVYAYDPRFSNVVYLRDNEMEKGASHFKVSHPSGRSSGIYQFDRLKGMTSVSQLIPNRTPLIRNFPELCDFQARLTLEKVVLDIASVKLMRLSKANSRSTETFSSIRLQIWHEAELRRSTPSDESSFVTAGTALSGPLRGRLVANSSRLMIYLGRLGEYITLFSMSPAPFFTSAPYNIAAANSVLKSHGRH